MTVTVPLSVPDAPFVTVRKLLLLLAVHAHPAPWVTVTVNRFVPPPGPSLTDEGVTLNAQGIACVTVTVWPANDTVPVRAAPVLGAATTIIDALPVPDALPEIVRKPALLTAVQLQLLLSGRIARNVTLPPLAGTIATAGETSNAQERTSPPPTTTVTDPAGGPSGVEEESPVG
jgi:hypothetical protein